MEVELAKEKDRSATLLVAAARALPVDPATPPTTATPVTPATPTRAPEPTAKVESTGQQWDYDEREDRMTGGATRFAIVLSSNLVNFSFPYTGPQHGSLALRNHPRHGRDVIFRIERGQLLCHSFEDCEVWVRFDDAKPERFAAVGGSDHSTEALAIRGYDRFVNKLRKSKMVRLSVKVYQEGTPVFEFDVSGFDIAKFTGKKN